MIRIDATWFIPDLIYNQPDIDPNNEPNPTRPELYSAHTWSEPGYCRQPEHRPDPNSAQTEPILDPNIIDPKVTQIRPEHSWSERDPNRTKTWRVPNPNDLFARSCFIQTKSSEIQLFSFSTRVATQLGGEQKKTWTEKPKTASKNQLTDLIFLKISVWLTELNKFCGFGSPIWDSVNRTANRWLTETKTYTFIFKKN